MIGALFRRELLHGQGARRAHRLLCGLVALPAILSLTFPFRALQEQDPERFVKGFRGLFLLELVVVLLLAPALVAGLITEEKSQRTLAQLLTTDLTAGEILRGKLLGRLVHVFMVILAGLPSFCLLAGFLGLSPAVVPAVIVGLGCPALAVSALAALASVESASTNGAALATYFLVELSSLTLWIVGGPIEALNPLSLLDAVLAGEGLKREALALLWLTLGYGGMPAACLALAASRLRPVYRRQSDAPGRRLRLSRSRVRHVVGNPVYWKERCFGRLTPLRPLRFVPHGLGLVLMFVGSTAVSSAPLWSSPGSWRQKQCLQTIGEALDECDLEKLWGAVRDVDSGPGAGQALAQGTLAAALLSFLVGIRCSGAIQEEKERGTWDGLLLTSLGSREILSGKLRGILTFAHPYLLAYGVPALLLSLLGGVLSGLETLVCLLLTVPFMYLLGAVGLSCALDHSSLRRSGILVTLWTVGILAMYIPLLFVVSWFHAIALGEFWGGRGLSPLAYASAGSFTFSLLSGMACVSYTIGQTLLRRWADRMDQPGALAHERKALR